MCMGACGDQKRVSGARIVIGSCGCLYGCWELNLGSLERETRTKVVLVQINLILPIQNDTVVSFCLVGFFSFFL